MGGGIGEGVGDRLGAGVGGGMGGGLGGGGVPRPLRTPMGGVAGIGDEQGGMGGGMGGGHLRPVGGPRSFAQGGGVNRQAPGLAPLPAMGYGPGTGSTYGYGPMGDFGSSMGQDYRLGSDYLAPEATLGTMGHGLQGSPRWATQGRPVGGMFPAGSGMASSVGGRTAGQQPSRVIIVSQIPPDVTYEELCDAVGAYGHLESIKITPERNQALVAFVSSQDALTLMISNGGQVILHGRLCPAHWGKNRPLAKELLNAIRNGATRNLYLSHVPETSVAALTQLFDEYGELESIRVVPKKRSAFVNFTTILSAIHAKDDIHGKVPALKPAERMTADAPKPMLINFTSAQQNCMRARGGGRNQWAGANLGGAHAHGATLHSKDSRMQAMPPTMHRGAHASRFVGCRGGGRPFAYSGHDRSSPVPTSSRAIYIGSIPDAVGLCQLAELVEPVGVIESLRLMRPKSCAFINFHREEVARALVAKYTASEEAAPHVGGKRLTVNFAKARPCSDEQLKRITDGARRKLRLTATAGTAEETLRSLLGHKEEMLLSLKLQPPVESMAGEAADSPVIADLAFTSVAAAISAKAALTQTTEGQQPPIVVSAEFILEPVAALEDLQAMTPSPVVALVADEVDDEAGAAGDLRNAEEAEAVSCEAEAAAEAAARTTRAN